MEEVSFLLTQDKKMLYRLKGFSYDRQSIIIAHVKCLFYLNNDLFFLFIGPGTIIDQEW